MNPRERLRAFLEQRREMGETEFVLDSMHVDDVLRVLGAGHEGAVPGPRAPVSPEPPAVPRRSEAPAPARTAAAAAPPGEPVRRGDPSAPTDWRDALRAVGAGPDALRTGETAPETAPPRGATATPQGVPAPMPAKPAPFPSAAPGADAAPIDLASLPAGLIVGAGSGDAFAADSPWHSLDDISRAVASCTRCPLAATAKNPVPGAGNPSADFVCVGEAPGANEDEQGVPFVGQAGQLLTKILAAINLSRDDVFICNVLKHRPPGNRNPAPDEVAACSPYLVRQIELLRPKVILALGTFAAQTLLQTKEPIGKLRGRLHRYHGVPVIVTYHPAALLRNPSWKRPTWEDVQLARKLFDRVVPT